MAERTLLSMMFAQKTLKVSSVMGKKIKKNEPARTPLDKRLLDKLIGKQFSFISLIQAFRWTLMIYSRRDRKTRENKNLLYKSILFHIEQFNVVLSRQLDLDVPQL